MVNQGQVKRGIAVAAAVTISTLALLNPFAKAQTLGPDRIELSKPTVVQRDFSIGSWTGSYSAKYDKIDQYERLGSSDCIRYNQQISYYPNNADKNLTALIGPDDNPKCEKFRIISFERDGLRKTVFLGST